MLQQQRSLSELAAIILDEQTVTAKALTHMKKWEQLTDLPARSLTLL